MGGKKVRKHDWNEESELVVAQWDFKHQGTVKVIVVREKTNQ